MRWAKSTGNTRQTPEVKPTSLSYSDVDDEKNIERCFDVGYLPGAASRYKHVLHGTYLGTVKFRHQNMVSGRRVELTATGLLAADVQRMSMPVINSVV